MADSVRENLRRMAAGAAAGLTLAGSATAQTTAKPPVHVDQAQPQPAASSQPVSWKVDPNFPQSGPEWHAQAPSPYRAGLRRVVDQYQSTGSVDVPLFVHGAHLTLQRAEGGVATPLPGKFNNVDLFVTQASPETQNFNQSHLSDGGHKPIRVGFRIPLGGGRNTPDF